MTPDPREIPIIFTGEMIRAIYADLKTETRRIVKWPKGAAPRSDEDLDNAGDCETIVVRGKHYVKCPYGGEGDVLYVRETTYNDPRFGVVYRADDFPPRWAPPKWTPAIHMLRTSARLRLDVVEYADLERLSKITDEAALAEGIVKGTRGGTEGLFGLESWHASEWKRTPRAAFLALFEKINGRAAVEANPFVWVVKFRRRTI